MIKSFISAAAGLLVVLYGGLALAAISPEDAERLGKDLTPMGAERAGNGGEIPEWTDSVCRAESVT